MVIKMVLNKRCFRELENGFFKYFALFMLIVLSMYFVASMCGAADTVIRSTKNSGIENYVEDGEFSSFVPLSDKTMKELSEKGVTVNENFYLEFSSLNNSTLRIFKCRKIINIAQADTGRLPENGRKIMLEKHFAEKHGLSVGDKIKVGNVEFMVSGVGSAPDYELVIANFTDLGPNAEAFGIGFVSDESYRKLYNSNTALKTEEYLYSYLLNGRMTDKELKEYLTEIEFDENLITDTYLRQEIDDANKKKDEITSGITKLEDGSSKLTDGLSSLTDQNSKLKAAAKTVFSAMLETASDKLNLKLTEENYAETLNDLSNRLSVLFPKYAASVAELKTQLDGLAEFKNGISKYTSGVSSAEKGSQKITDGIEKLQTEAQKLIDENYDFNIPNLTMFTAKADNVRIGAASDDVVINKLCAMLASVILMLLISYVMSVFIVHNIDSESPVIGALYSMGYNKKELIRHYLILPTVIALIGGAIGTVLGFISIGSQCKQSIAYFSYPVLTKVYSPYIIVYCIVIPPVISLFVNLFLINGRLSAPPLKLLRHEKKQPKISKVNLGGMGFINRFRIRQMLREIRGSSALAGGMLMSLMLLMIGLNCYSLLNNMRVQNEADQKYNYMYTLKYMPESAPKNAEPCYAVSLNREALGYDYEVTLMGISKNNPYFNFNTEKGKNEIVLSDSAAWKYGVKEGDKISFTDKKNEIDYSFTVKRIVPYSIGLQAFMNIDSMRDLFGQEDNYYNILLSNQKLNIDPGRIYSLTTKAEVLKACDTINNIMQEFIITMFACSVVIFIIVMYLMLKMMIDKSAFSISLMKAFGYNDREVKKLYLGGSFYTVLISAVVCVPLSKLIIDAAFPYMVSNIACGCDFSFSPALYLFVFGFIFITYFIVNLMLTKKLKKISAVEILKNRE